MVINLKKDKNVRTPPVIKEPRPLLTMGDVWNVAFVAVAFLLQKASGAILTFVKIPYNAVNGVIKAINKIPLAGKAISLPLQPLKLFFGFFVKIASKLAFFFKVIFIVLIIILALKILLKILSRISYMRNKKKFKEYYEELEDRMQNAESQSVAGMDAMNYY